MELKIISQNQNPLFKRNEVQATADSKVTPTHSDVKTELAKQLSTQPKNIKIKGIKGSFGSNTFEISANIYDSKEEKDTLEIKKKREKQEEEKAKQEAEKPEEVKQEAQPAEAPQETTEQPSQPEETKPEEKQDETQTN